MELLVRDDINVSINIFPGERFSHPLQIVATIIPVSDDAQVTNLEM